MKTKTKQSVPDALVTNDMITEICNMVFAKVSDVYNPSQKEIVSILMNTRLSHTTIARVVKEILPQANPTKDSVRSLINHIKNQDEIMSNFMEELREELNVNERII